MNSVKAFLTTPTKRRYRRLLVILFYGLVTLGGILSTTKFDPGTTGGALLGGIFTLLLLHATANMIFTPSSQLDERQQRLQNLTFRSAYYTLMGLAALYIVLNKVLEFKLGWLSNLPTTRLLSIISLFVIFLPITIFAWTEPDPLPVESESAVPADTHA